MTLRRVYDGPQGWQVLVIYQPDSAGLHVAMRPESDWSWGPPLECIAIDDIPDPHQ